MESSSLNLNEHAVFYYEHTITFPEKCKQVFCILFNIDNAFSQMTIPMMQFFILIFIKNEIP